MADRGRPEPHGARHVVTGADVEQAIAEGLTVAEIAARLLRSPKSILNYMLRIGFGDFASLNSRDPDDLRLLLERFGTIERVADYHGLTTRTAADLYRRRGIEVVESEVPDIIDLEEVPEAPKDKEKDKQKEEENKVPVAAHIHHLMSPAGGSFPLEFLADVFKMSIAQMEMELKKYIDQISRPLPDEIVNALRAMPEQEPKLRAVNVPPPLEDEVAPPPFPIHLVTTDNDPAFGNSGSPVYLLEEGASGSETPSERVVALYQHYGRFLRSSSVRAHVFLDPETADLALMHKAVKESVLLGPRMPGVAPGQRKLRFPRKPSEDEMRLFVSRDIPLARIAVAFGVKEHGIRSLYNRMRKELGKT